jgi:signal transduction histidine kinase
MMREDYQSATKCFLKSLSIEEKFGNTLRIADLNDELGTVYYYQEIFAKSLGYYTSALTEYEKRRDTMNMAKVYSHLGNLYSSREFCEPRTTPQKKEDFDKAIQLLEKTIQLCTAIHYKPLIINSYVNIASVYNKLQKPDKALVYLKQATDYYRTNHKLNALAGSLHTLGITYFKAKQYSQSARCFEESLKIALENKYTDGIQYLYESMAQTYFSAKDYKNAYEYYVKYMTIRDSLVTAEKSKQLFELETKYQTEKKENEIIKLKSEKREKNVLLLTATGITLLVILSSYFVVKNARNKKLIADQNLEIKERYIRELEKERQLVATKSVLKGEESERSRMARDLHDGLGGLLSGVKINLSSMKGNSIITSENAQAFDHAIRLLDNSISELRRVAHNLMPETLNHYGLKTALHDFMGEMGNNPEVMLTFSFFGADIRFESQLELTIYRIAQELVNNALKHAGATKIDLQLIADVDRVCIQVVDNGKGFDTKCNPCEGKGLFAIRDRVTAYNGTFELESAPGHGTEASIEFLLS